MAHAKETAPQGAEGKGPSLADRVDKLEKIVFARERMLGNIDTQSVAANTAADEAQKHAIVHPRDQAERNAIVAEVKAERHKGEKKGGRIYLPLVIATFFAAMLVAYAAENIAARWVAEEGNDLTIELAADQEDDTADEAQITMGADGVLDFSLGGTDELTLSSTTLAVTDDLTVADDMTVTDDATVSGFVIAGAQTITITNTHAAGAPTLTPTASTVFLSLTGESPSTGTLANATFSGQLLTLVQISTGVVIVADSANVQSTGPITNGQWDSLMFVGDMSATNWIMLGTSNN